MLMEDTVYGLGKGYPTPELGGLGISDLKHLSWALRLR